MENPPNRTRPRTLSTALSGALLLAAAFAPIRAFPPVQDEKADQCCRESFVLEWNKDLCVVECEDIPCAGMLWEVAVPATCRTSPTDTCIVGPNVTTQRIELGECTQFLCIWDMTVHSCIWEYRGQWQNVVVKECNPSSSLCPMAIPN